MATAATVAKILREAVKDFNYWAESESDTPLEIKRTKGLVDEAKILSFDKSMRAKATGIDKYVAPERTVQTKTLDAVFKPIVANSLLELQSVAGAVRDGSRKMEDLEVPAEAVEYYIQLYAAFKLLPDARVCYVSDKADATGNSDPYTGLFIIGTGEDGETVYARALLVQT